MNEKAYDKAIQEQLYKASLKWIKSSGASTEKGDNLQLIGSDKKDEGETKVTQRKQKVAQSVMERVSLT